MDIGTEQLPPPDPEQIDLFELINTLETKRQTFFASSEKFARKPSDTSADALLGEAGQITEAIEHVTSFVIGDSRSEPTQKGNILATIIKDDDLKRVAHFNRLTGGKYQFTPAPQSREAIAETITESLTDDEENVDDLVEALMEGYRNNMSVDLNEFINHINSRGDSRLVRLSRFAGRHALDIAKTSAAVAVGIWLTNRRRPD